MSKITWSEEQLDVINFRDCNLLVSAAAGSGKTAVLVERIAKRITDPEKPIDVDRLLVVTFTKAAAAEMRERVGNALEELRKENPEDVNLSRQLTLIHNAQITTIDSFCLFVVRNHFEEINLDPSFRVADEGEIKLLEKDVLDAVMEANYGREGNEAFLQLVDAYFQGNSDQVLKDMVLEIYRKSNSNSWPEEWLEGIADIYDIDNLVDLQKLPIFDEIVMYVKELAREQDIRLTKAIELSQAAPGLEKYVDKFIAEREVVEGIFEMNTFDEIKSYLDVISASWGRLPSPKKGTYDEKFKEAAQSLRDKAKKAFEEVKKKYFAVSQVEVLAQIENMRPYAKELIRLSMEFYKAMQAKKRQMHIADFNDIEHFALQIFVDPKTKQTTETARTFRKQFEEIMIDEYQDSNQVQEDIMKSISREEDGGHNLFMVGDVKQSIYRFRLARPELFMEKYDTYVVDKTSPNRRIDLHKNFRSRSEVLAFTNTIFFKIMKPDLGKVDYDHNAALYLGADYVQNDGIQPEILLLDKKDIAEEWDEDNKYRAEANLIGAKIKQMMVDTMVTDKKSGELREMRFSDIVILLRGAKQKGDAIAQVLNAMDVPCYISSSYGYFSAYEVQIVLNMLRILDNPYQDIPMASVLRSPMVGLDEEDLSALKEEGKSFAASVLLAMDSEEDGALQKFGKIYHKLRRKVNDTPIHDLIRMVLEETDFMHYASSLPSGNRRSANLDMLLEKAIAYEGTSYHGLFHFVRYIDELEKYEVDYGEADVIGEKENVVRIMTIHKSKGLEFPVVFVSATTTGFNTQDEKKKALIHPELGIGLDEVHAAPRRKKTSILKTVIGDMIHRENLGEELRVLYVALTRAKEKLILTGVVDSQEKFYEKHVGNAIPGEPLSYAQRVEAKCYMDWVAPAVLPLEDYEIEFVSVKDLVHTELTQQIISLDEYQQLKEEIANAPDDVAQAMKEEMDFVYPYPIDPKRKSKYSVSELKHASMERAYEATLSDAEVPEFVKAAKEPYLPSFLSGEKVEEVNAGALQGTAVHRVMEGLDFTGILKLNQENEKQLFAFCYGELERMLENGFITQEMKELVNVKGLVSFVKSPVALRMANASKRGELFKEKPFVMDHEGVLVQGIIDVFWLEDDKVVVLDYKTDAVSKAEELVYRYKVQLDLYKDALGRIFNKTGEACIYSFRLQEVISL